MYNRTGWLNGIPEVGGIVSLTNEFYGRAFNLFGNNLTSKTIKLYLA